MKNDSVRILREACRRQGIRLTPQRLELLSELLRSKDHPSAEELYRRVRERMPTLSLDTVYRTLATFEQLDLAVRLQVDEGPARFDGTVLRHHHFVCDRCRRIIDFSWPDFDRLPLPEAVAAGGGLAGTRVEVHGVCPDCR